jgi:hypothetical protein
MYTLEWTWPDGQHRTIATCHAHIPWTLAELKASRMTLSVVDPAMHTCKGCLEGK